MWNWSFGEAFMSKNAWFVALLAIWDLVWKGKGMWKAAGRKEKWWFMAMLLINSVGILPIVYLNFFTKDKKKGKK